MSINYSYKISKLYLIWCFSVKFSSLEILSSSGNELKVMNNNWYCLVQNKYFCQWNDDNVIVDMFHFRYYQFDSVVVREILGRKLSSRNRKDMDDVSEKTRIPIRSCRRQVCTGKTLSCHDVPGKLSLVTMYLQNFL